MTTPTNAANRHTVPEPVWIAVDKSDLRIAEVVAQDIHLGEDGSITYRTKLRLSFKYETGQ